MAAQKGEYGISEFQSGVAQVTKALMIQGAGSNVGKSVLVAGLARALTDRGYNVRPFKPQNMSNNAAVTSDGGEIGRAQALQARACHVPPTIDMNPVLLKPETDRGAQVVVHGRRMATVAAREYAALKPKLLKPVLESYARLASASDIVLVEGAGSPAETNLRLGDIANMGFAEAADIPVVIIGDIDRGGVIAQLVGTHAVLDPPDSRRIKGFIINKFRGDPKLFDDGYALIGERTGWRGCGVIPWFSDASKLPSEDALDIEPRQKNAPLNIACLTLSRIANFDDLDPLSQEPGVSVQMIRAGQVIPADSDLVIIPGSKSTRGDLEFLRAQGWDIDLAAHVRRGGWVLGLCGGYQMLGNSIDDPEGIEGPPGKSKGLGFLNVETVMHAEKALTTVRATHVESGTELEGYEIHIGSTEGPDRARPFAKVSGTAEGAIGPTGRIQGTYLHGLFSSDAFRREFLAKLGAAASDLNYVAGLDQTLDDLAAHLEKHSDIDAMIEIAEEVTFC